MSSPNVPPCAVQILWRSPWTKTLIWVRPTRVRPGSQSCLTCSTIPATPAVSPAMPPATGRRPGAMASSPATVTSPSTAQPTPRKFRRLYFPCIPVFLSLFWDLFGLKTIPLAAIRQACGKEHVRTCSLLGVTSYSLTILYLSSLWISLSPGMRARQVFCFLGI